MLDRREDADAVERRAHRALPADRLAGAIGIPERREDRELLLEEVVVVVERVAEERERLGERAAAEDHLGAAARDGVEGGEALVDADRVVGAEHRDGGAEADALGAAGDGGEHDLRRADGEVRAVVLAHAEEVDADLVGQLGLRDDVAEDLGVRLGAAVGVDGDVAEGVEAEFEGWHGPLTGQAGTGFPGTGAATCRRGGAPRTRRRTPASAPGAGP